MTRCPHAHHRDMGLPTVAEVRWAEINEPYRNMLTRSHELFQSGNAAAAYACLDDAEEMKREVFG